MPPTSAASALLRWLQSLRSNWVALAQGGTWVMLIVGGLLYPPPAGVQEQDAKLWLRVGQFVATAVVGILFVLSRKKGSAEYLRMWLLLSCLLLIFGVAAVIAYYHWQYTWTCSYARTRVIVGSEYTDFGRTYAERE